MIKTATIAGREAQWRYSLGRYWGHEGFEPSGSKAVQRLKFVMLNPSTADGRKDDPTIRRCIGIAKREGYAGIEVVNLFAWRDSDPGFLEETEAMARKLRAQRFREMKAGNEMQPLPLDWYVKNYQERYVGPENDPTIFAACLRKDVVVAWGAQGPNWRAAQVQDLLREAGAKVFCLGRTKAGKPRHPLYVPGSQKLEPWWRGAEG